jgi:hypothetical protein
MRRTRTARAAVDRPTRTKTIDRSVAHGRMKTTKIVRVDAHGRMKTTRIDHAGKRTTPRTRTAPPSRVSVSGARENLPMG